MHETLSAEAAVNPHYLLTQARKESVPQPIMPPSPLHKEVLPRLKQGPANAQPAQQEKGFPTSPSHEQILQLLWQL